MSTRQLIVAIAAITLLTAALVWFFERFEVARLHTEVATYLDKIDKFKAWEANQPPA